MNLNIMLLLSLFFQNTIEKVLNFTKKSPFFSFVVLGLLSQIFFIIMFKVGFYTLGSWLRAFSPLLCAAFVITVNDGFSSFLKTVRGSLRWKVSPLWYLCGIMWFPVVAIIATLIRQWWFNEPFVLNYDIADMVQRYVIQWHDHPLNLAIAFSDEIAWFGFAYVFLQQRMQSTSAALIIGVTWSMTYIPCWIAEVWVAQHQPLWTIILGYIGFAVLNGWIYNATKSAIVLAITQVISANYAYTFMNVMPKTPEDPYTLMITSVTLVVSVSFLILVYGWDLNKKK